MEQRLAAAELAMSSFLKCESDHPLEGLGYLLAVLKLSEPGLVSTESEQHADLLAIYNEANAEIASLLHQQNLGIGGHLQVPTPLETCRIAWAARDHGTAAPGFYDTLTPTSRIKVKGFDRVNERPGIGGTLVGYRKMTDERLRKDPMMSHSGYGIPITAGIRWRGEHDAEVVLYDMIDSETVEVRGRTYQLAADYTPALATVVNVSPNSKTGFMGMLRPQEEAGETRLCLSQPFRKDRIPLILVHGLMSTPDTWREVINACYADPVVRANYQILTFFYPTGYPILGNAATLREKLKAFQKFYDPGRGNPLMRDMVVVGHSMGCNLTNFQIHEGGDPLWDLYFTKPVDEVATTPALKRAAERRLYFKANPDIARVVFICGPHRGSPLADEWIGRFGNRLIHFPFHSPNWVPANVLGSTTTLGESVLSESFSSINNLEPHSPILEGILKQRMAYRKPVVHSIVGDRGRGGGVDSSDGVVPYWSSHLDWAKSEVFIPASHTQATNHPQNVAEVRRILHLHVGKPLPRDRSQAAVFSN